MSDDTDRNVFLELANLSPNVRPARLQKIINKQAARIEALEAENKRLREALLDVLSHLVAAESLLFRGGKSAAPSDKMFDIMLQDYRNSIERGRAVAAALEKK